MVFGVASVDTSSVPVLLVEDHAACVSQGSCTQGYRSTAVTSLHASCLIQEYEKRLLAKDHDLKCSQAQLEHARVELAEAKKIQAEGSRLLPAPEAHDGSYCASCQSKDRLLS